MGSLLVHAEHGRALGGFMYNAIMSAAFSSKSGSSLAV
jgi:hypothetical protein